MGKQWKWALGLCGALAGMTALAAELTATERQWLAAAAPVLAFAHEQALPLDIVVRPSPTPGEAPMGMAFVAGRCKLVLSMRGNPEAQATLDRIEPRLVGAVVEAIAAHELAHCWRHLLKDWGSVPEGLDTATPPRSVRAGARLACGLARHPGRGHRPARHPAVGSPGARPPGLRQGRIGL
jgi:hypothetical protein